MRIVASVISSHVVRPDGAKITPYSAESAESIRIILPFVHAFDREPRVAFRFRVDIPQRRAERDASGIGFGSVLAQHEFDQVLTEFDPLGRCIRHIGER